jgi:predicted RNA-binding protein
MLAIFNSVHVGVWLSLTRHGRALLGDVSVFSTLDDGVKRIDVLKMSNIVRGVLRDEDFDAESRSETKWSSDSQVPNW